MSDPTDAAFEAIHRLLRIAERDTGQSKRVADFLLAWWNAQECGGFDLTDLWTVDDPIRADMLTVIQFIAVHHGQWPNDLGLRQQFAAIQQAWRPQKRA